MKEKIITDVLKQMQTILDGGQLMSLKNVLEICLHQYDVAGNDSKDDEIDYIELFLAAKRIEGRSEKSLIY